MCQTDFCIIQSFCFPLARCHCQTWGISLRRCSFWACRAVSFPCRWENLAQGTLRNRLWHPRGAAAACSYTLLDSNASIKVPVWAPAEASGSLCWSSLPLSHREMCPQHLWKNSWFGAGAAKSVFITFGQKSVGVALPLEGKESMPEPKQACAPPSAADVPKNGDWCPFPFLSSVSPSWHRHRCSIAGSCLGTWNSERRKTGCRLDKEKSSNGSDSVSILKSQEKIYYKCSFLQSGLLITLNTKSEPYIFSKTKN